MHTKSSGQDKAINVLVPLYVCIWVHIMPIFVELSEWNDNGISPWIFVIGWWMAFGKQFYLLIVNFTVIAMAAIMCSWCVSIVWGAIHARCCCYRCTECFGFYQVGGLTCIDNTCSNNNWNSITLFYKFECEMIYNVTNWNINPLMDCICWSHDDHEAWHEWAHLNGHVLWCIQLQSVFK